MILSGELTVQQAPMFDCLPFDPFALFDDGIGPAEVGVGGRHVVQALVVTSVVIMLDERFDLVTAHGVGRKDLRWESGFDSNCRWHHPRFMS